MVFILRWQWHIWIVLCANLVIPNLVAQIINLRSQFSSKQTCIWDESKNLGREKLGCWLTWFTESLPGVLFNIVYCIVQFKFGDSEVLHILTAIASLLEKN